jgi:hypothetical protein
MTDRTYARLLQEITEKQKTPVPPGLKRDILDYYAAPDAPITTKRDRDQWKRVQRDLAWLREMPAKAVTAGEGVE